MANQHSWHVATSEEISDILIPAGASLLDGLRLLLVHHLRASAGTAPRQLAKSTLTTLANLARKPLVFDRFLKRTWRLHFWGLCSFGGSTEEVYGPSLERNCRLIRLPQVFNILQSFRNATFNVRWHPLTPLITCFMLF